MTGRTVMMTTIEVSVYVMIRPTERLENVVFAVEKIFPGLIMDIRGDRIEAYNNLESLRTLHKLLREQQILDTARSVMLRGQVENTLQFRLNKQAAFMGVVNFPPEEEPLGSIHVQITGESVIDWLAPRTENGVPIKEIDSRDIGSLKTESPEIEPSEKEKDSQEEDV
jgi:predicted RNA binding protein with dsRBD fold (UPF0201 family)